MHKKKLESKANVFPVGKIFSAFLMNPVPLACELFAHQPFHSSWISQNTVLASDLASFEGLLRQMVMDVQEHGK
jgi:hypothetical protein